MEDGFGVAVGPEATAEPLELGLQLRVVVDLAVINQRQRAVFAPHGHVP